MTLVRHGPYGNDLEGGHWELCVRGGDRLQGIGIRHGHIVDGIDFEVRSPDGNTKLHTFGGHGGNLTKISMRPNEHVTQISGRHGIWVEGSNHVIASIKIHTNFNPGGYGPYGSEADVNLLSGFSSPQNNRPVNYFFGNHGVGYLRSIGVGINIE